MYVQVELRASPQHWLTLDVQGVFGHTNVVALDDIDLTEGPCTGSANTYFLCNDGTKIPQSEVNLPF